MDAIRHSCRPRAGQVHAARTALACWSSKRPNPSLSGMGCGRRREPSSRACVAAKRLRWLVIAWKAFSYTLGGLVIAFLIAQLWFYGHILYWSKYPPASTAFMERSMHGLQDK